MTDPIQSPRLRFFQRAMPDVCDIVAIGGFGVFTKGLWMWFGQPVALTVAGSLLMILGTYAAVRGGR